MRKPCGSTVAKQATSARPGFQPSAAAQSAATAISSGRIARMRKSSCNVTIPSGPHALPFQRAADLLEDGGIVDRRRHGPGLAVGDLLHGAAENLARARLRQPPDGDRELEGGDRPDFLAYQRDAFPLDLVGRAVDARLEHDEAGGHVTLERVADADHR